MVFAYLRSHIYCSSCLYSGCKSMVDYQKRACKTMNHALEDGIEGTAGEERNTD